MQAKNLTCLMVISLIVALLASGCTSQEKYDDLKLRNQSQQQRIDDLESQVNVAKLKLTQIEKQFADATAACAADADALNKKVEALQGDIEKKEERR
jgi:outer membrane murein-binding lipoprotein Lpp